MFSKPRRLRRFQPIVLLLGFAIGSVNAANACKLPKSYYKHVSCTASSQYFLAVKDSGAPVALLNKQGKKAVDLSRYSQVDVFKLNEGLMPVQRSGKVGYVNMSGREVVPAIYDVIIGDKLTVGWARAPNNGRIIVKKKNKFGIIDYRNKVVLPFSNAYQTIEDYKNNKTKIEKSSGVIWVDKNARKIAAPTSQSNTNTHAINTTAINTNVNNRTTNNSAPEVIISEASSQPRPNSSTGSSSNSSTNRTWQPIKRDGKWGFINQQGIPMITFSFEDAKPFSEALAAVKLQNKWGFVDLQGELVIAFKYDDTGMAQSTAKPNLPAFTFKNGKAWVGTLKDGTALCIDKKGVNISCQ